MADAGEIKARVVIEYDGSGIKQAKEDLASLAEAAGSAGQSAGNAGEGLAGLGEQAARSAGSTKSFNEALAGLPKIAESGNSTISGMTSALSEHQSAVEETGAAYESLQKPIESTISSIEKAAPSIQTATEHTQKFAQSVQTVSESFDPGMLNDFTENTAVFQDALMNPQPFSVIGQHLRETGQNWQDFTSSLSAGDEAMAYEMAGTAGITEDHLNMLGAQLQTVGTGFHESASGAEEFTKQFNGVSEAATRSSGSLSGFYDNLFGGASEGKSVSLGGAFSEVMGGVTGVLNDIAMPLMAVQMIGMAVQATGQAIYDSAAIAEGPAAHSFGSFTGTVDALGESLQRVGSSFSEGFGQAFMPTLNALNNQAANGDLRQLGGFLGGVASTLTNLTLITTGIDPLGGTEGLVNQGAAMMGLPQPFQGPGPTSKYQLYTSQLPQTIRDATEQAHEQTSLLMEESVSPGFLAQQQQLSAAQTIYQRAQQSYNISHPVNQGQMIADAQYDLYEQQQMENYRTQMNDQPSFLEQLGGFFSTPIVKTGGSTPNIHAATSAPSTPLDGLFDAAGSVFGGIGQDFHDLLNGLFGGGPGSISPSTAGCFPAGTSILLSDGSSKAIEAIQVDDVVFAHDGESVVPTPVLACIRPRPKLVYELVFSDGKTLVTTDSHPVASLQGWKSIVPDATAQENPDLHVTRLQVGDVVKTIDGTAELLSIQAREVVPIYNITVGEPHTFYASGVLVHNKKLSNFVSADDVGQQTAEQIGGIQLPHIDLSGMAGQIAGSVSGIEMPHIDMSAISGSLAGAFSGISMPPIPDIGSQLSGALGGMFSGITMPAIPDIGGMLSGALGGMFGAITMPAIPDIGGMLSGALSGMFGGITIPSPPEVGGMISGAMSGLFGGVEVPSPPEVGAMINGAMSGIFGGIQIPAPPNLGAMINGAMSSMFSGISVPMFAGGVSNFSGGPAIVGEGGAPEVVGYNGGYALFDKGAAFVNLPAGANVYPMQNLGGSSVAQFANGTGGGSFSPLAIGGGGTIVVNLTSRIELDSQVLAEQTIPHIAPMVRAESGYRGY